MLFFIVSLWYRKTTINETSATNIWPVESFVDCCKVDLVTRFYIHSYISQEPFWCYEKRVGALSYSWNTLWILDYSKQMNLFTWKPTSGGPKWFSFAKSARATTNVFRMFSHSLHRWSIPQEVKCIKEGFAGACCDDPSAECTKEFASPKKYIQPDKHTNIQTYKHTSWRTPLIKILY